MRAPPRSGFQTPNGSSGTTTSNYQTDALGSVAQITDSNGDQGVTLTEIREVADLLAAVPAFGAEAAGELAEWFEQHGLFRCASRV